MAEPTRVPELKDDPAGGMRAAAGRRDDRAAVELERDALRRQLAAAEENERRRLSRELHDQLGQHLTALTLGLDEIVGMLPDDSPALPRLASLLRLTTLLTRDVRYLALELRPPELDDVGLESAMATYIDKWASRFSVPVEFEVTGAGSLPGVEASSTVYRILQEALTNVAKHSSARQVSVILEFTPGAARLIVEDDGRGFDVANRRAQARAESRLGLAGMEERAMLLGGTLEIESVPGEGATLFVSLPADAP